ncbi:MAG: SET domain-containing protein-lysine N-methyltransferase [Acidobacteriales bacterium]|nr:SET domain-containing protein-lysine N-methyltransferase [Terriglobales bacterium]
MGLIIRSSPINGAGCYTTAPIRKGARVLEYTGPRMSKEEADRLYEDRDITYLFGIGDGTTVIDGYGMAAFLNHSCDPNCETDERNGRIFIYAIRNIRAGEELVYDYNLYDGELDDPAQCYCGTSKCRGTMYSPEEIERREKLKSRAPMRTAPDLSVVAPLLNPQIA